MKKIFSYAMMLLAVSVAWTSCEDDNDSNPTLVTPTVLTVNEPVVGQGLVDLSQSNSISLTWSQPVFTTDNAPVVANYEVQVSPTGSFTKIFDEAAEDNTGADYFALGETYTECVANVPTYDIDKGIVKLNGWQSEETADLSEINLSVRVRAFVQNATMEVMSEILSNVVNIKALPFYIELKDALPQLLFFVGPGAVGNWNNSADTPVPMSLVADAAYDKKTGEGEFTYTGWFAADQFKLVLIPGAWEPMYGLSNGTVAYRAPGAPDVDCWVPDEDGYYTFKFSTLGGPSKATASLEKYAGTPKVFDGWELIGSFNGWGDDGTVVLTQNDHTPHIWHATATFNEDSEAKFRLLGSWGDECGGDGFPYGLKTGNNIKIAAGTYKIVYNDIDRCYFFISE